MSNVSKLQIGYFNALFKNVASLSLLSFDLAPALLLLFTTDVETCQLEYLAADRQSEYEDDDDVLWS